MGSINKLANDISIYLPVVLPLKLGGWGLIQSRLIFVNPFLSSPGGMKRDPEGFLLRHVGAS